MLGMIRKVKPVRLTDREMSRFYGYPFSGPVLGVAARRGLLTVALGGIFVADDGKVWGFIDIHPTARFRGLFRHTKRFLDGCREDGVKEINVTRDEAFSTSENFLSRLGFVRTEETFEGKEVWKWRA